MLNREKLLRRVSNIDDLYCQLMKELYQLETDTTFNNRPVNKHIVLEASDSWNSFSQTYKKELLTIKRRIEKQLESGNRLPDGGLNNE